MLPDFVPAFLPSKLMLMKIWQILHNYRKKETHDVCFIIYIAGFIIFGCIVTLSTVTKILFL